MLTGTQSSNSMNIRPALRVLHHPRQSYFTPNNSAKILSHQTPQRSLLHTFSSSSWVQRIEPSRHASVSFGMAMSATPPTSNIQNPTLDGMPSAVESPAVSEGAVPEEDVIVQYVVLRKDLVAGQNWPLGSLISQGCHAAVAAVWLHREDPVTVKFCGPENLDNMHSSGHAGHFGSERRSTAFELGSKTGNWRDWSQSLDRAT